MVYENAELSVSSVESSGFSNLKHPVAVLIGIV